MKRCNDCASDVYDSDAICTACRMREWKDQINVARAEQARRDAIDAANAHYYARKNAKRVAIHRIIALVLWMVAVAAFYKATEDAIEYEYITKPAMLKANGVR